MGYSQVVRHSTLTAAYVGSNPTSLVYSLQQNNEVRILLGNLNELCGKC